MIESAHFLSLSYDELYCSIYDLSWESAFGHSLSMIPHTESQSSEDDTPPQPSHLPYETLN